MSDYVLSDIIRKLLIDLNQGSGDSGSWPIYSGFLPDSPTEAIVVYETAGTPDGRLMVTGERIEHPGIQIRIRSAGMVRASLKTTNVARALDSVIQTWVDMDSETAYLIQNVSRTGTPLNLGPEAEAGSQRRFNFTLNAIVTYRKEGN